MELPHARELQDTVHEADKAMNDLLLKLDEAIDDMENGRVQTIDEAWKEITERN